ncbi:EamA family transporter [Pseudohalocynthiibacter aestuariivivens]|jgi:drug/metabolite transporter (DMT)-like permease|uniref:EamA family transporter n=1 Tax=Pseudohalocynthiibacter aestuariivivens TaxID=1591409 RepID=A0ABV5JAZ2_9RHOB|nr:MULTISPECIES: DMT family transporter [Pseudohalocynthiibacter]MBS9715823.1 EamA family transporter [Pseudohalocynthiibacter aestuariivivens]MCK0101436.1 DMT family transporter [Pseudohalocynthiibacter sp. F2068]
MGLLVFYAVITAALLHALWNALVKSGTDKHLSMCAVVLGHMPLAVLILPFVPTPAIESWPYLLAGIGLHIGYQVFLLRSYHAGDLTQVYPIARGTAPLLVAGVSVLFLGVVLHPPELFAIALIGAGILSISLVRQKDGLQNLHAARLAFVTGCFIASYSLVDGLGARLAGTALGFYGWLAIGNGILFAAFTALTSPRVLRDVVVHAKPVFFFGGSASFVAYGLVIWAFTQAPIALVTALRETSIIFALLIGVFFLKEPMNLVKVLATMATLLGAALLRFSKQ